MDGEDSQLTAYCGIYCGDCIRYRSKAANLASELCAELERLDFEKYAKVKSSSVKELARYREAMSVLAAIARLRCEEPCRLGGGGCGQPCDIKGCAQSKDIEGCWECDAFEECRQFDFLEPFHGDTPKQNLRAIRRHGIDKWATHREKLYPWLKT